MKRKTAAAVLSALIYAQGLLAFAGVATVLLKDHAHAAGLATYGDCDRLPGAEP